MFVCAWKLGWSCWKKKIRSNFRYQEREPSPWILDRQVDRQDVSVAARPHPSLDVTHSGVRTCSPCLLLVRFPSKPWATWFHDQSVQEPPSSACTFTEQSFPLDVGRTPACCFGYPDRTHGQVCSSRWVLSHTSKSLPHPLHVSSMPPSHQKTKSVTVVVFRWMRLGEILSPSFWANIWIDYARFDEAYTLPVSAGFNIDVGNGHSTLLPTVFQLASMVRPLADPKAREEREMRADYVPRAMVGVRDMFGVCMYHAMDLFCLCACRCVRAFVWFPGLGIGRSAGAYMDVQIPGWLHERFVPRVEKRTETMS